MGHEAAAYSFRILAVDDDREYLAGITRVLSSRGFELTTVTRPKKALDQLADRADEFDVIMMDVSMPEMDGITLLGHVRRLAPELPVIMVSGDTSANTAATALRGGAFDYLTKPLREFDDVVLCLTRAAQHRQLRRRTHALETRLSDAAEFQTIIGRSRPMKRVFEAIDKLAASSVNVLILGESGTGKELVARAIHDRSARTRASFVAVNCAGLPETLIDSELFGHVRGAFTGAVRSRAGAFEQAQRGTIFLDEIGDLPMSVQGRLLRVLQERQIRPLGQDVPKDIDVRVVAATLVDLEQSVAERTFRNDLYYRLNVVSLVLPPLRERMDDLPLLLAFFLKKHGGPSGKATVRVNRDALDAMQRYPWPGNVRELENTVQRALALCDDEIDLTVLPPQLTGKLAALAEAETEATNRSWDLDMTLAEAKLAAQRDFELTYLVGQLKRTSGNVSAAARAARMDRSNFRKLLQRNGVDPEQFR